MNRTGDTLGTVTVDYSIVYLPPPGSAAATTLTFSGFVQFQSGMDTRDFSVTLPDNAFLETGGSFMATIENATLISGGNYDPACTAIVCHDLFRPAATFLIPPVASPRVGTRSQVLILVPVQATSGFISFAVQSLQVHPPRYHSNLFIHVWKD